MDKDIKIVVITVFYLFQKLSTKIGNIEMTQSKLLEMKTTVLRRKILEGIVSRSEHGAIAIKLSKTKNTEEQKK